MYKRQDLFRDGLSGGAGSKERRNALLKQLELPEHLTSNGLIQVLNSLLTYEEYQKVVEKL